MLYGISFTCVTGIKYNHINLAFLFVPGVLSRTVTKFGVLNWSRNEICELCEELQVLTLEIKDVQRNQQYSFIRYAMPLVLSRFYGCEKQFHGKNDCLRLVFHTSLLSELYATQIQWFNRHRKRKTFKPVIDTSSFPWHSCFFPSSPVWSYSVDLFDGHCAYFEVI